MDGEKERKRKAKGRRGPYKKFYVEENCRSDTLQGDEDMTHQDSIDMTIEVDAAVGVPALPIAVNSGDVDIELQVQVCCMLLHFNLRLMNFQKD